jgi:hypothetical protein
MNFSYMYKYRKLPHIYFLCTNVSKVHALVCEVINFPCHDLWSNTLAGSRIEEVKARRFRQDVIGATSDLRHSLFCTPAWQFKAWKLDNRTDYVPTARLRTHTDTHAYFNFWGLHPVAAVFITYLGVPSIATIFLIIFLKNTLPHLKKYTL